MKKGLKCPKCKSRGAYITWGRATPTKGMFARVKVHYKQKICSCGFEGSKHYFKGMD
jgi:hypothetical protein